MSWYFSTHILGLQLLSHWISDLHFSGALQNPSLAMLRQSVRGLFACVIATLLTTTAASALPFRDFTPRATKLSAEQVGKELMPTLSTSAAVYTAGDARWANATARWQTWNYPNVYLVIEPGSEADVPKIVRS